MTESYQGNDGRMASFPVFPSASASPPQRQLQAEIGGGMVEGRAGA